MKNTKEIKDTLLPEMLVIPAESEEDYVEKMGLSVAESLNFALQRESEAISGLNCMLEQNIDLMADSDVDKIKKIISQKKANVAILQEMTTTYDEIEVDKSAAPALKKLLKRSK